MRIIFNSAHQRFGGSIQVAYSFIQECKNFPEHEYHIWLGAGLGKIVKQSEFPENFIFYEFDFGPINLLKTFKIQRLLRKYEEEIKPDIMFSTSGPSYYHSKAPQIIGFNLPLYIYPESPYVQELSGILKIRYFLKKKIHFHFFKKDAIAYVAQTDDVRDRVKKALQTENVYTVSNTANSFYNNYQLFDNKLPVKKENRLRFVTITSYYYHKNLEIIPDVIFELEKQGISNVEFVLTVKPEDFKKYIGENEKIINIGPIKPAECPSLYNECDFLFLPTLAECFSASYPEAMIMKKPIVTTDLGFARSICKDAAIYYKPKNAKAAADQIIRLLNDTKLQDNLIENGQKQIRTFDTPSERAKKYLQLCETYSQKQ